MDDKDLFSLVASSSMTSGSASRAVPDVGVFFGKKRTLRCQCLGARKPLRNSRYEQHAVEQKMHRN
jgi:hypothetical protein